MNAWERRELHLANERLRDLQDENARLRRVAKLKRRIDLVTVIAVVLMLVVMRFYGADIARAVSGVLP